MGNVPFISETPSRKNPNKAKIYPIFSVFAGHIFDLALVMTLFNL